MKSTTAAIILAFTASSSVSAVPVTSPGEDVDMAPKYSPIGNVQVDVRPYWLVEQMEDGPLKTELSECAAWTDSFSTSKWSIGHRGGGTLQMPEHSLESNLAGARMGAGFLECDVAFTKDRELVCRHSHCDLHETTNIVTIPELNAKCQTPFVPSDGAKPAQAKCCTQDITLAEFKTLCAKMEGSNPQATTPEEYIQGTPGWRTDLYSTCGTPMSLKEHIRMVEDHGLRHIPELKVPDLGMPWEGYTQEDFASQMLWTYDQAEVSPSSVYPQSFSHDDIMYWMKNHPNYAKNLVFLEEEFGDAFPDVMEGATNDLVEYAKENIKIIAPPMHWLVESQDGKMVPSKYARAANNLNLNIIAWTAERSGFLAGSDRGGYYYQSVQNALHNEGDVFEMLNVLRDIGVIGVFSDWAGTTTFFDNCMNS
ncbi:hypothetical protein BROUX41_006016 [Berkeleyomyces rouxiae]|uniref:uncharacterized protein n=1 Tax=Berkeleyomyces rouxiae TaxID=2035830 RepID=UPI003B7F3618